ncbi:MAG: ABC transporter permease [Anaerolineae bacterium]|nr:ABC transporter permease [Anaerolineae bacterium]MDW8099923.1 ABC transporter permease [Anaerolineae bacterium]
MSEAIAFRVDLRGWWQRWRHENESLIEDWRRALYRFRQSTLSMVGLGIVLFLFLVALTGPWWVPYPEDATGTLHIEERFQPPSLRHPFGTDEVGRDIFTRTVIGTRISFQVGVIILVVAISIGVTLGGLAGYLGGWISELIMRLADIMLTFPGIFLALSITAALGPGVTNAMLALSITWWPGYARLVQAQVMSAREDDYVQAAKAMGASHLRIIFRHILPNIIPAIIVKASMDIGFAILSLAALGFIGVGAQPPVPEWGAMISKGRGYLPHYWWYSTFPGLAMFLTVFGFNLLGDGLRDVVDPRSRR